MEKNPNGEPVGTADNVSNKAWRQEKGKALRMQNMCVKNEGR